MGKETKKKLFDELLASVREGGTILRGERRASRTTRGVIDATSDLRAKSGRLSATLVAEAFGISVAEVARSLGQSRQAVTKTSDSKSLQKDLQPFERIARLRSVLVSVVLDGLASGETEDRIARDYRIFREDVRAALLYAGELTRETVVALFRPSRSSGARVWVTFCAEVSG